MKKSAIVTGQTIKYPREVGVSRLLDEPRQKMVVRPIEDRRWNDEQKECPANPQRSHFRV